MGQITWDFVVNKTKIIPGHIRTYNFMQKFYIGKRFIKKRVVKNIVALLRETTVHLLILINILGLINFF